MADLPTDIILQVEDSSGGFSSRSFSGVPASRGSLICICSTGSPDGRQQAAKLAEEIEAVLLGSSPEAAAVPIDVPGPEYMVASADPDRLKVLVLVASKGSPLTDIPWYANWYSDEFSARLLTVLPSEKFEELVDASLPEKHLLKRINAARWVKEIREVLPRVLSLADITAAASRIFISYRRLETLPVALQLFDELSHHGFEVFLDRYTIPPGFDFQRRLSQELEDKSMVVLLESKYIRDSEWTQVEIDFAKTHRLGMATLRMPDVDPGQALSSTTHGPVILLDASRDFTDRPKAVPREKASKMNEWPKLTDAALATAVAKIKTAHADALFERRHRLRVDLTAAFLAEGLSAQYRAVGPLVVGNGPDEHLVWPITRPPEVDDFRLVCGAHEARHATTTSRALIVGPQAEQEPDRKVRLKWLHAVSKCVSFDEGDLKDFAQRIKEGRWQ